MEPPPVSANPPFSTLFPALAAGLLAVSLLAGCSEPDRTPGDISLRYSNETDRPLFFEFDGPNGKLYGIGKGAMVPPGNTGSATISCGVELPNYWLRITLRDEKDGEILQVKNWTLPWCSPSRVYDAIAHADGDLTLHNSKGNGYDKRALPTSPP